MAASSPYSLTISFAAKGEILDILDQKRRNKAAALKLLRKLLRNQSVHPETITTDKLASYGAAALAGAGTSRAVQHARFAST
jgi:putative transposase